MALDAKFSLEAELSAEKAEHVDLRRRFENTRGGQKEAQIGYMVQLILQEAE